MKNPINYLVGLVLSVLVFAVASSAVMAQVDPAASPAGGTFDQRLSQRKAERKIVLDEKNQKRLVNQCVRAQTEIRKIQGETRLFSTNRAEVYRTIDAKLWITVGKLKLGGVDTFKLEKQQTEFNQGVGALQVTLKEYQQALDDTVVINCAADPLGFKALLDTTRIYYAQLIKQSAVIRNLVLNGIKPTLTEHTTDLQPKSQGSN